MMWSDRMRARLMPLLILALTLPLAALPAEAAPPAGAIVVLHDGVDAPAVAREHAARHAAAVSHVYSHALTGYAARIPAAALPRLQADPRVRFVAADRAIQLTAQTLPTGINRVEADVSSTRSGNGAGSVSGVNVAVIDSGIDPTHPDLNVVGGANCVDPAVAQNDGHGHGTHVAGIIGARDNGIGAVGVAPGIPLYAVKSFADDGSSSSTRVLCGLDWVAGTRLDSDPNNDIHVVNMSFVDSGADDGKCGTTNNDALHVSICNLFNLGVTLVAGAGNDAADLAARVPAAYDEVLAVTAMADFDGRSGGSRFNLLCLDVDDTAADFSNFTTVGSLDVSHTIAAPGVCIYSTHKNGGYTKKSGTSMASPHVAGAAALCLATRATTGKCTAGPAGVMADLRAAAAARPGTYGFKDDPGRPNGNRYYGYLLYAGGY